ncbi:MAG: DUF6922 domain-containing protein [Desulfotomaculales bacterium]
MKLPSSFAPLFHNYVFDTVDADRHAGFVIKTVLAQGTWEQIRWLFEYYGAGKVREVFLDDYYGLQALPESTRRLWELLFVDEPGRESRPEENGPAARWRVRRLAERHGRPARQ